MKRLSKMVRRYAILTRALGIIEDDMLRKDAMREMDMYARIQSAIRNPKRTEAEE